VYNVHEDGESEDDAEIRGSSKAAKRTRKESFAADGSWGLPPARVGRCQARRKQPIKAVFLCRKNKNKTSVRTKHEGKED